MEWTQVPFDHTYGGQFRFVDEGDVVMTEMMFPDNSVEYIFPGDEDKAMKAWLEDNPGWTKDCYGRFVKTNDNEN